MANALLPSALWDYCLGISPTTAKYFSLSSFAKPASVRKVSNWRPSS